MDGQYPRAAQRRGAARDPRRRTDFGRRHQGVLLLNGARSPLHGVQEAGGDDGARTGIASAMRGAPARAFSFFRVPFLFYSQSALRRLDSLRIPGLLSYFCGGSGQAVVPVVPESESGRGIPSRTLFRSGGQYGLSPPAPIPSRSFILQPDSPATGSKFVILYDDTQTMEDDDRLAGRVRPVGFLCRAVRDASRAPDFGPDLCVRP